jgi:hypothetical protein
MYVFIYVCTCVYIHKHIYMLIPVAARSKARFCGPSLAGVGGSNPAGVMDFCVLLVLCVVHVEDCASGQSLVQRCPTDSGVYECDCEASIMKRLWPNGGC